MARRLGAWNKFSVLFRRRQIRRMRDLQMAAIRQETRELEALRVRQVNRATWPVAPLEKLLGLS